jgi:hypothetical protein
VGGGDSDGGGVVNMYTKTLAFIIIQRLFFFKSFFGVLDLKKLNIRGNDRVGWS